MIKRFDIMDAVGPGPTDSSRQQYDDACAEFTRSIQGVANWKHTYHGAAYTTRLKAAIADARIAANRLEAKLIALGEIPPPTTTA